ncbi:Uncharacterized protein Adt_04598 [Abeliophyllum distichum]|uniref:Uncharacterized protein n=1 Tax=Abeliophyllum distichum TaxID=126358 RepID=A0ABD1V205_9LAMI
MEIPPRTDTNALDRPHKSLDIPSTLVGHLSSVFTNPQTGFTPLESGLMPPNSLPFVATLGLNPIDATAISTGCAPVRPPPISAPSLSKQFGGSIDGQSLAPANLGPGQTRGSPNIHGHIYGSNPTIFSHAPTWV